MNDDLIINRNYVIAMDEVDLFNIGAGISTTIDQGNFSNQAVDNICAATSHLSGEDRKIPNIAMAYQFLRISSLRGIVERSIGINAIRASFQVCMPKNIIMILRKVLPH